MPDKKWMWLFPVASVVLIGALVIKEHFRPVRLSDYEKARSIFNARKYYQYDEAIKLCKSAIQDDNPGDDAVAYKLWAELVIVTKRRELKEKGIKSKSTLEEECYRASLAIYKKAVEAYPENKYFQDKISEIESYLKIISKKYKKASNLETKVN